MKEFIADNPAVVAWIGTAFFGLLLYLDKSDKRTTNNVYINKVIGTTTLYIKLTFILLLVFSVVYTIQEIL